MAIYTYKSIIQDRGLWQVIGSHSKTVWQLSSNNI